MAPDVNNDRDALRRILARLDQLDAEAETMLAETATTDLLEWWGNMRQILAQVRANVIEQLSLDRR